MTPELTWKGVRKIQAEAGGAIDEIKVYRVHKPGGRKVRRYVIRQGERLFYSLDQWSERHRIPTITYLSSIIPGKQTGQWGDLK